jgi:hypothetical protein
MAEANKPFVIGFICQNQLSQDPAMVHMTPGVQLGVARGAGRGRRSRPGTQARRATRWASSTTRPRRWWRAATTSSSSVGATRRWAVLELTTATFAGRGVYEDKNPAAAAQRYKEAGWSAYEARVGRRAKL